MLNVCAILGVVAAALVAVDQLALWLERRGWIFWRKAQHSAAARAGGGGMAGVLTGFQRLVEPQVRHVIEDREERRVVRLSHSPDGAGTPDTPRASNGRGAKSAEPKR